MGLGRLKFNIKCDMKVKLFKGLLAVMLIGLFVSCSQKKEDFQNDKESKRMVVNKVKKDYVPEGKKFYLVDVSGSMQGKGSVRTSDIFTSVIEDMSFAFSKITDSCEIVIIPFSSMPLSPISFNSFDKENMNTALQNLTVSNGNTNIYSAFQKAVEKFDSTTNNIVFFITDGLHNEYVTEEVLYETLNSFSEKAESKYSHLYYYLKTPDYKEFDFYKVFEKNDNMDVIESLVFTKEVNDTTFVTTPIVADSKGGFEFPMWLKTLFFIILALLLLALLILLMILIIRIAPYLLRLLPCLPFSEFKAGFLRRIFEIFDRLPKSKIKELIFKLLGKPLQNAFEELWKRTEKSPKNMDNNNGFLTPKDYNEIPSKANPNNLSWKDILGDKKGVRLKRNGELDLRDFSKCSVKKSGLYNKLSMDKLQARGGGNNLHDWVGKIMAKKLGMSEGEFWNWKAKNNLVIHEDRNCKTFHLVDNALHLNISHLGGIGMMGVSRMFLCKKS